MTNEKELNELLNKIDNIKLVSKDDLDKMDFYELCYYMQTLNTIDALANNDLVEEE